MDFELRPLCASDIAPMCKIISRIGLKEIKGVLSPDSVKELMALAGPEGEQTADEGEPAEAVDTEKVGFGLVFDLADIICVNIEKVDSDVFHLLGSVAGMKDKEVAALPLGDFADLLVAFFSSPGFTDFFTRVSKQLN